MAITKLKRIAVHETVYQQLKQLGSAGDSFNDVIVRILSTKTAAAAKEQGGRY